MLETNDVIRKINKLFSLAGNNPSEEEAQAAMLKAQEMLLASHMTMAEVESAYDETRTDKKKVVEESREDKSKKTLRFWQRRLIGIIGKNFKVDCFTMSPPGSKKQSIYVYVGLEKDVQAAQISTDFIFKAFIKLWNIHKQRYAVGSRRETMDMRRSYAEGFAAGLQEQFQKQVTEMALVIVKDALVVTYMNEKHRNLRSGKKFKDGHDSHAYQNGFKDGKFSQRDKYL